MTPTLAADATGAHVPPNFPPSANPRVWLLTSGVCPIGIAVARALLKHGDSIVLGVPRPIEEIDTPGSTGGAGLINGTTGGIEGEGNRNEAFRTFWEETRDAAVKDRCRAVSLDGR